jgi:hypothetical protein
MKKLLVIVTALAVFSAGPAHAGFVPAAVAWVSSTFAVTAATAAAALNFVGGIALNAIAGALYRPKLPGADVSVDVKVGDNLPLSFVVGESATAGKRKYVGNWGDNTRFITEVLEYSALPQGLDGLWINDERGNIRLADGMETLGGIANVGYRLRNYNRDGATRIWVRWLDGTQMAADQTLINLFGNDPDYPWTATHIGRGKSYAIVTSLYDDETLTSYPDFLVEPTPLPLYDWRFDSTVGGSGDQRWGDRSTHRPTRNPAVIAYNIARGIYFGTEWVYGGKNLPAWRLPIAEWTAAANACDQLVTLASGATEPRYRCGLEISVDMEPASVLDEIGRSANMKFAEVGGRLKPIVDLPGAAVFSFTDGDILTTEGQSFSPFYPASDTFNAITASYPERGEKWATKDAPEYIDTAAREDDGGRYLPTSMSYGAVPFGRQVQRLMRSQMRDFRRTRIHQFYLAPDAYALEPGIDMVSWTSDRNGYINKLFVVESVSKTPGMNVLVSLREVDPSDYDWSSDFERPIVITPPVNPRPFVQTSDGFNVAPSTILDQASNARRPDVLATYVGDQVGITSIQIRARVLGRTELVIDTLRRWNAGQAWRSFDVLPSTTYEFQARLYSDLTPRGTWSPWRSVTTPDVGFSWEDWDEELRESIQGDLALIPAAVEAAADASGRADAVRRDHDALVEGFVGKLTDLSAADQGIQQRIDLIELSVSNSSYIRKTDGDGPSIGSWAGIGAAATPTSATSVPPGQTGRSIVVNAPGAFEGPTYTGASLNGTTFRIRGWIFVSAGATARAAIVDAAGATIAQSEPITGGWQQIDRQFTVNVETGEWAPAFLVTAGGTMRFFRVRLEDYSAAASLEASIAQNARAILDEQTARVASVGTLTARANSLAGRLLPSDMLNNGEFWTNSLAGSPETIGGLASVMQFYTSPAVGPVARIPLGQSSNIHIVSKGVTEYTTGKVIRLTVKVATIAGTTDRLRALFVALRSDFTSSRVFGTNMIIRPTVGGQFQTISVDFVVPAALADEVWLRIGVFSNASTTPDRAIDVASIRIDDITASEGVRGELTGEITSIKGLDLNALDGTAFGVLLDQLEVTAGGTSAKITAQGSAIADLEGNASSVYGVRVQAGGAASILDLIASDGSGTRPTSIARLDADDILLEGSVYADKLAVVGVPTLVHDPLYKRLPAWLGLSSGASLGTVAAADTGTGTAFWGGERILQINASTTAYARVISRKVHVKAGNRIKIEVPVRALVAGRTAGVRVFFFATEAQSIGSPTAIVGSGFIGTTAAMATIEAVVPAGCAWMALELANSPAQTGASAGGAWFGFPELRNMDAANLIVQGGVVADMITAETMRALNGRFSSLAAANVAIGNAEIGTLQIAGNAVVVPVGGKGAIVSSAGEGNWRNLLTLNVPLFRAAPIAVSWAIRHYYYEGGFGAYGLRIRLNGNIIEQKEANGLPADFPSGNAFGQGLAGNNSVVLQWQGWGGLRLEAQGSMTVLGIQ